MASGPGNAAVSSMMARSFATWPPASYGHAFAPTDVVDVLSVGMQSTTLGEDGDGDDSGAVRLGTPPRSDEDEDLHDPEALDGARSVPGVAAAHRGSVALGRQAPSWMDPMGATADAYAAFHAMPQDDGGGPAVMPSTEGSSKAGPVYSNSPVSSSDNQRLGGGETASLDDEADVDAPPSCDFGVSTCQPQYVIGRGSFAVVWKGIDTATGTTVAIKSVRHRPRFREGHGVVAEETEAQISSRLQHDNIVALIDWRIVPNVMEVLVFEYMPDGDLYAAMRNGDVDEAQAMLFLQQAAIALEYIHESGYVHGDVKLENMLISGNVLKLCDFGLSGKIGQIRRGRPHGTTEYMAPELLTEQASIQHTLSPKSDMWSFALVLYAAIFFDIPWLEATEHDDEFVDFVNGAVAEEEPWTVLAPEFRQCMLQMLSINPAERPPAEHVLVVLRGPWLAKPAELEDYENPRMMFA